MLFYISDYYCYFHYLFCVFIIIIMFLIYSKERKNPAVTHTHNTEINITYIHDYSRIQIHSLKKKKHGINM